MQIYSYETGDLIKDDKRSLKIIEVQGKMIRVECTRCNWRDNWINKYNLAKGNGCSCCSGKTVVEGINDIPTTAPWMVKYFQGGYEEAKLYTRGSNKKIIPICPDCGAVKDKPRMINKIMQEGLPCNCSDGRSYPEKVLQSVLSQLNLTFHIEYTSQWSQKKRYDFYIPSLNLIIEAHGLQHYQEMNRGRSYEEEHENDLLKFDLSVINGIEHYVVLDCRKSELKWIKNSIINSVLPNLLGFVEEDIDWDECECFATSNLIKQVSKYKEANKDLTTSQIGKVFGLHASRVGEILKKGNQCGWCTYNPTQEKTKVSRVNGRAMGKQNSKGVTVTDKNGIVRCYSSILNLCECAERDFGVTINRNVVSKHAKSHTPYKDLMFAHKKGE